MRDQIADGVTGLRLSSTRDEKLLLLVEMGGNVAVLEQFVDLDYAKFAAVMEEV